MITLTREEAQQVLDAFLGIEQRAYDAMSGDAFHECSIAVSRLRAQLAQPEPKPVAWMSSSRHIYHSKEGAKLDGVDKVAPVYVHPPKEWRGLTDEEIMDACAAVWASHPIDVGRIIEAKLREKNASHL